MVTTPDDHAPAQIFRYRGYVASDLANPNRRARLDSEIANALRGKVWFSPLSEQNDPFDTNVNYIESKHWEIKKFISAFRRKYGSRATFTGENYKEMADALGKKASDMQKIIDNPRMYNKSMRKITDERREKQKICCFSVDKYNVLLWSYYSFSHSSFCLRFDCPSNMLTKARSVIASVKYISERPQITTLEILQMVVADAYPEEISPALDNKYLDAFMLTKSNAWSHEVEWRSMTQKDKQGYRSIEPYKLAGIVFGCRASDALISHIRHLLPEGFLIEKLSMDPERYELRG